MRAVLALRAQPPFVAALTPSGEDPPPDVVGLACLTGELEGAPEKDRILAVLSGADPSGEGLTLEESAALGEAVGGDPTARFTTNRDMTGWTGCNSYGVGCSIQGEDLCLDDPTWTEAGCPSQELFQQEQRMQDLPATVERFEVSGERLTLHTKDGQALAFERAGG